MLDLKDTDYTPFRIHKATFIKLIALVCLLLMILVLRTFKLNGDLSNGISFVLMIAIINFPNNFRRLRPIRTTAPLNWHGGVLVIKARLVPKFFWTTASIAAHLDGICILKTGGQRTRRGMKESEFWHEGARHIAELSWTPPRNSFFYPFELKIDHAVVESGEVYISNSLMSFVSIFLVIGIIWDVATLVFHINR